MEELKIKPYFFVGGDEVPMWLMSGGELGGWGIPSFFFILSCVGSSVSQTLTCCFLEIGGLMVKKIVFDIGRKTHLVPWKYGRYFFFVLLICFNCLVQKEY